MLIKSECQALDKTRHKPAWSLFEQRHSCKMAGEICSVACRLEPAQPCSRHLHQSVGQVQRDRRTSRRPCWDPARLASSAGCHQPAEAGRKPGRRPLAPTWMMMPPSNLSDNHASEGESLTRSPACNYAEQRLCEQHWLCERLSM